MDGGLLTIGDSSLYTVFSIIPEKKYPQMYIYCLQKWMKSKYCTL